jgi:hypothetical protein
VPSLSRQKQKSSQHYNKTFLFGLFLCKMQNRLKRKQAPQNAHAVGLGEFQGKTVSKKSI